MTMTILAARTEPAVPAHTAAPWPGLELVAVPASPARLIWRLHVAGFGRDAGTARTRIITIHHDGGRDTLPLAVERAHRADLAAWRAGD